MSWRTSIARLLAPEEFEKQADIDLRVNQRVADVLLQMDPFEPLMKKYNVIFSEEWQKPEERLDSMSVMRLVMWAHGLKTDPNFIYLTNWIRNTQGNATIRKAKNPDEWLYGRAAVATITLFVEEVGRLSSKYEEIMFRRNDTFDKNLPVGEV